MESNTDEEEPTTSTHISKESSKYDMSTEDEEESGTTETLQVHNDLNNTTCDEHNSSEPEDDKQKFGIWHTSGCLMVDVPCLDHLWDGRKDPLDVGQVRCSQQETPRKIHHCMLLGLSW